MGIYLPMSLTLLIPVGAVLGWFYDRWAERAANPEFAKRMGVLMATGLIVGESLFGVVFAGIVWSTDSDAPLALVGEAFAGAALPIGLVVFTGIIVLLYRNARRSWGSDRAVRGSGGGCDCGRAVYRPLFGWQSQNRTFARRFDSTGNDQLVN